MQVSKFDKVGVRSTRNNDQFYGLGWPVGSERGDTEAIAVGMQPVSLGKRILRAVTAPIVAMSLVATLAELKQE